MNGTRRRCAGKLPQRREPPFAEHLLRVFGARAEETADANVYPGEDEKGEYLRFRLTESGISPRALPGMEGFIFAATGL